MDGYLHRPDLTRDCMIEDWYRTGDLGGWLQVRREQQAEPRWLCELAQTGDEPAFVAADASYRGRPLERAAVHDDPHRGRL